MLTELGKFLRKLRIDNGQLLKDMADILGISSANLSAVENGKRKPQDKMIDQIIKKYHLTEIAQNELKDAAALTREEINLSLNNATERQRNVGLAFARQFDQLSANQMDRIMEILSKKQGGLAISEFLVPPASKNAIRQLAYSIRKQLGLINEAYFPVLEFIEYVLPEIDSRFNYEIVPDTAIGLDAANYNPSENTMRIRQSVYEGACEGNGRDRFTIAHEIGHYLMHRDVNLALSRLENHTQVPAYQNSEWQANTFASALLMPPYLIGGWNPRQIAKYCGTSLRAAEIAYKEKKK